MKSTENILHSGSGMGLLKRKFNGFLILAAICAMLLNGCEQSVAPEDTSAVLEKGGPTFSTELSGANEVPSGDPDGSGTAVITIMQNSSIAFEINVTNITLPAIASHIHHAGAGVTGPVVVTLTPPDATGYSSGVVENVDKALLMDIKKNPSDYYVNVHTTDYPGGAVRGQLVK